MAILEFIMQIRLASNSQTSVSLCLLSAGIELCLVDSYFFKVNFMFMTYS